MNDEERRGLFKTQKATLSGTGWKQAGQPDRHPYTPCRQWPTGTREELPPTQTFRPHFFWVVSHARHQSLLFHDLTFRRRSHFGPWTPPHLYHPPGVSKEREKKGLPPRGTWRFFFFFGQIGPGGEAATSSIFFFSLQKPHQGVGVVIILDEFSTVS